MPIKRTLLAPFDELSFQDWYKLQALKTGNNPNPDDPEHYYDYRGAYTEGGGPSADTAHWTSKFKDEEHPRRYLYVDGKLVDTANMEPVKGMPKMTAQQVLQMMLSKGEK